jgi:hypothetical protein
MQKLGAWWKKYAPERSKGIPSSARVAAEFFSRQFAIINLLTKI